MAMNYQNDFNEINNKIQELMTKRQTMKLNRFNDLSQKGWFELLKADFESSSQRTAEYTIFHRKFKREFTKTLKQIGAVKVEIGKPNHFDVSGFFQMQNGQIFYFSLSDLRWSKDFLLVRTAKDFKDYSGGSNQYCNMQEDYKRFIGDLNFICNRNRNGSRRVFDE